MNLIETVSLKSGEKVKLYKFDAESDNGKNILIIGVCHGEEPQGFWAIEDYFFNKKKFVKQKNNIFIIPCLNPDGMKKSSRKNATGVDLNRNFPTKNWEKSDTGSEYFGGNEPASEFETRFAIKAIEVSKPDFILTLHSPYAIVNYDGNAQKEAGIISEITGYPVQKDIGYPTPGSFGTYCGVERKIPTVTLEYDEKESKKIICEKSAKIFDYIMREY